MTNYQLYHTNVYLGGQMKYDLVLSPSGGDLVVSDFHISPIFPLIPFNKYAKENLLNYSHQENIKRFYRQISSSFYNQKVNPMLENPYPIMTEYSGKLYDDTYEMGCRRMSYKLYNRQFEFLCPLWLEKLEEGEYLNFELSIYTNMNQKSPLSKKNIIFRPKTGCSFHNKFVEYLNNYLDYTGIRSNGVDSVFNIDPISQISMVEGLNVETGMNQVKQLPHLLTNLFGRELPLMEFDNHIIRSLQDNKLITKQLFNFNLCFNPEHLISDYILGLMGCEKFTIKLNVAVEKENGGSYSLDVCDLYSNYEYIPKKYCGPRAININSNYTTKDVTDAWKRYKYSGAANGELIEPNVLEYMKDYKCVDYIDKNKITQPIIHWSLYDNNDYIFNAYNGFGGYHITGVNTMEYSDHKYDNTPSLRHTEFVAPQNSNCWCNSIILNPQMEQGLGTEDTDISISNVFRLAHAKNIETYFSDFGSGIWNNGLKRERIEGSEDNSGHYKILIVGHKSDIGWGIANIGLNDSIGLTFFGDSGITYVLFNIWRDEISDVETAVNGFTLNKAKKALEALLKALLKSLDTDEDTVKEVKGLLDLLNSIKDTTKLYMCPESLELRRVDSSSLQTDEMYYEKSSKPGTYVERYFGKIKPTFIVPGDIDFNYKYFKVVATQNNIHLQNVKKYNKYIGSPVYPSIGYFFLDKISMNYNDSSGAEQETNSFNSNTIRCLRPEFEWILTQSPDSNGQYLKIKNLVQNKLNEYYNIEQGDLSDYIMSLYEYTSSFDYVEGSITDYKYDIKLTLK